MPHATRRGGSRGSAGSRLNSIKRDPDQAFNMVTSASIADGDEISRHIPPDQAFYRNGRSDAPTPSEYPSERPTEPEPLLREIRTRSDLVVETSPRSVEESFFHTSFQDIGKKLKACNDTLGELQQLGVSHDVQLPELVLVGDQSAGKSSLMSGLANLDLPRSEGTCTRCPLHIRVSSNTEWSCRVWLRKEYSYKPPDRPIDESDVTEEAPFYPWKKTANNVVHEFKTMHDKSEIEEVLRWAQIAILNDDRPHHLFVPGSGAIALNMPIAKAAEETAAKFSPNVVALEIKGPGLPDLSFYDMPGIFQNPADAKDDYLVNVVRNLSKAYIQHPSAIIICSMPMNSDAENSCTFGLTRKLGALSRTIGVLTKADLLPSGGNHAQWLDIMRGATHTAGLGYFITSRPQGKDLEELKSWEDFVFEDHSYEGWPSSFHTFSHRCGVEKLKAFLSERLGEEFAKSLPNIKHKVKHYLDKITRQLATLPELPHNVELEIQTCLNSFADSSRTKIDEFAARINDLPANFRDCLLEIKPKFILKDRSDIEVLELSDDESDAGSIAPMAHATPTSKRRAMAAQATPSKRPRLGASAESVAPTPSTVKPEDSGSGNGLPPPAAPQRVALAEPFKEFGNIGRGFRTLRQVHDEIQTKMKAGMPNIIPPEVYNDLAMESIRPWNRPTDVFLKQIIRLLQHELEGVLNMSLESLKKRFIYTEAKRHLKSCLEEHWEVTQKALHELYSDETERLMTFNEGALQQCIKDEEDMLFRFRHQMRMHGAGFAQKPLLPWESLTEEKQTQDVKRRQAEEARLKPDMFVREVQVVAYVRGYYRLAALRYADAVSQRIICRMIPAIRKQLRTYLDDKLGVRGPNAVSVYEKLMDEDEATALKRETLKTEREKFVRALTSIEALEMGASTGVPTAVERSFSRQPTMVIPRRESDVTMLNDDAHYGEA
ncbi:Interferon-induced GTP-binding Mx1-like protein [Cladobotryum mycophilum]|uniref:Interferon-induced GTP-binding Mx1-like protein n=1 Tax=Cladobotryum mycophilum TaxID=491253 RepID=A0ABR0SXN4_9HYPO